MRTRIKICGITNLSDARQAIEAGADALGFVFYEPSPRYISPNDAQTIIAQLPVFVNFVGLLVNPDEQFVHQVLANTSIDTLQFHGDETPEFCQQFNTPYFKALRVSDEMDVEKSIQSFEKAQAVLLDAYHKDKFGGTGEQFNWDRVPSNSHKPLILAGGLSPENVKQAVVTTKVYAVDVSSGVEQTAGQKSVEKMLNFAQQVRQADQQQYRS